MPVRQRSAEHDEDLLAGRTEHFQQGNTRGSDPVHAGPLAQLNTNMERLIEQIASANNHRYGRSSEKLDVIAGQLELELIFNEAEVLTETLYVVEPAEEDVIQVTHRKKKGKREADLKDLPVEVIPHTLPEEKLLESFGAVGWKQLPDEVYKRVRVQPAV